MWVRVPLPSQRQKNRTIIFLTVFIRKFTVMNKINLNQFDWNKIQEIHNRGIYWANLPKTVNISLTVLKRAIKEGYFIKKLYKIKPSDETKQKISKGRKKYLNDNPDKHPWKMNNKFISKPCEIFKEKLKNKNIIFIEEYQPIKERYYSIDIAFPNKLVGIEINGNQHYNNDGTLKEYYLNRNNILIQNGWEIINIHYSVIYVNELINKIIEDIEKNSLNKYELEFYTKKHFELKRERKNVNKKKCIDCGKNISLNANRCKICKGIYDRKVKIRPTEKELVKLLGDNSFIKIGKIYGVSDNAIRKWAKTYNII